MRYKIFEYDPGLLPFERDIDQRMKNYEWKKKELVGEEGSLSDFANGHEYFGFHRINDGWVYREWAPAADEMYLTGEFNDWHGRSCPMQNLGGGVFEVFVKNLQPGQKVQAVVIHKGEELRRIPLYATRVVQDPQTYLWCAELEEPDAVFPWTDQAFKPAKDPLIYECHIGMAGEDYKVSSYREFQDFVLPRIQKLGYNTIQIMAIMEHPYYGSFGYQVSSFFAASSWFGKLEDLKYLVKQGS